MPEKINWLMQNSVPGSLVVQATLSTHGISPQLAHKYVKNGWLKKLRSGVYAHPGKAPQWFNAVECLMTQLNFPIHLAGLTSLTYQGKAHYLQIVERSIWLEVPPQTVLPLWFREFPDIATEPAYNLTDYMDTDSLSAHCNAHPRWLFVTSNKLAFEESSDLTKIETSGTRLIASRPELAAFELLGAVPDKISFEHAAEVFQGLVNLSPSKVQSMLNRSNAIKTNRLFLFLANFYMLPFASRIDESTINLGAGKRQIVLKGKLNKVYQITVPEAFHEKP